MHGWGMQRDLRVCQVLELEHGLPHYFSSPCCTLVVNVADELSCLVACSSRTNVDRHTDRQTDTGTKYCNAPCACAPSAIGRFLNAKIAATFFTRPDFLSQQLSSLNKGRSCH